MLKKYLCVLLLFMSNAQALQKHLVKGEQITTLTVSQTAFNTIAITGDHILTVQWEGDSLEYKKDEAHSQIYVKPKVEESTPVRLTIITKNKHRLLLLLIPANIPPEEITLVVEANKETAAVWEKTTPYEQAISQIIAAMHQGAYLPGFELRAEKGHAKTVFDLTATMVARYYGDKMVGEILQIVNDSKETKYLEERDFSGAGVRAVAIEQKILPAKSTTRIFRVLANG